MAGKYIFDRFVALIGLIMIWPVFIVIAILIKMQMPGPVMFVQKRVGKNGHLFNCHKFRTMTVNNGGSSVSVAGENRITPLGAKLRKWKLDELPELWDVLIGNMSFVGPRPDVPGYADKLEGDDRVILKLRPGITGPATLKYRDEEELIERFVNKYKRMSVYEYNGMRIPEQLSDQDIAIWYNDNVIYPDKIRVNRFYYWHYSFWVDIKIIFSTVFGLRIKYNDEII